MLHQNSYDRRRSPRPILHQHPYLHWILGVYLLASSFIFVPIFSLVLVPQENATEPKFVLRQILYIKTSRTGREEAKEGCACKRPEIFHEVRVMLSSSFSATDPYSIVESFD